MILLLYFLFFNYQNNLQFFMIIFLLDKKRFCFRFSKVILIFFNWYTTKIIYIMYIIRFHKFLHNNITFLYFFLYCYIVKFHFSFLSNTSMEQSDQFMKFYISRHRSDMVAIWNPKSEPCKSFLNVSDVCNPHFDSKR